MARMKNPEGTNRKRTVEIRLKLSPALAEKFSALAEQRGILPATLAAVVIGEYLEKKDENTVLQGKVALHASTLMAQTMTPETLLKVFADPAFMQSVAHAVSVEEGRAAQAVSSAVPEAAARPTAGGTPVAGETG